MKIRPGTDWATAPRTSPSCDTWQSTSCKRTQPRDLCAGSSSAPAGTTPTSPVCSPYSEVRLPWVKAGVPEVLTAQLPLDIAASLVELFWPTASNMTIINKVAGLKDIELVVGKVHDVFKKTEEGIGETPGVVFVLEQQPGQNYDFSSVLANPYMRGMGAKIVTSGTIAGQASA